MTWLGFNLFFGYMMKELGKRSLATDLSSTLYWVTIVLLVYQSLKLSGSFLYLFKIGCFKYRVSKYREVRKD